MCVNVTRKKYYLRPGLSTTTQCTVAALLQMLKRYFNFKIKIKVETIQIN